MTTATEMREALVEISTALGNAVTGSAQSELPHAALVASIDQIRGFIGGMADTITDELMVGEVAATPVLLCAGCTQDARNMESAGNIPLPIHPATTIINGVAICDVEGRHRIVTQLQHQVAQASALIGPDGQQLPRLNGTG